MTNSSDFKRWVRFAEEEFVVAGKLLSDSPHTAVYLLQQASEKYLKAVLLFQGIEPPLTHNLRDLLQLVSPQILETSLEVKAARLINVVSIPARYPSELDDPTLEEAQAVHNAASVLRVHARKLLGSEEKDQA
jgi:HEPN domain-containing protein